MTTPPEDWVPRVDPSARTKQEAAEQADQQRRERAADMELVNFRLDRLRADLDAVDGRHETTAAQHLALVEEKIRGVCQVIAGLETRFADADANHDARSKLIQDTSKEALKISFDANKELSAAIVEQLKGDVARVDAKTDEQIRSLVAQLTAMKERIDNNEGKLAGETTAQITARANLTAQLAQANNQQGAQGLKIGETGKWIAIASTIIAFAVLVSGIIISLIVHTGK